MSDTYSAGRPPSEAKSDADRLKDAANREATSARDEAERAGRTLKDEAARFASGAKEKAFESVEDGKAMAASSLNDFTAAIRKASDELGERDQSMAANLVREAASGLESVSNSIEGKSVQEIARSVANFARRQPTAFFVGAALAGVALGRFARASGEHDSRDYIGSDGPAYGGSQGYGDRERGQGGSYGAVSSSTYGSRPSAVTDPAPTASQAGYAPTAPIGSGASSSPGAPRTTSAATASGVTNTPGSTSTPSATSSYGTPSASSTLGKPGSIGGGNER